MFVNKNYFFAILHFRKQYNIPIKLMKPCGVIINYSRKKTKDGF